MKRFAVFLLCVSLLPYCSVTAFAEENNTSPTEGAVISVTVPDTHTLTIQSDAEVSVNGEVGKIFDIDRLSEPEIELHAKDDEEIVRVLLNGEDITDKFVDGKYQLPPVYENLVLEVETKPIETTKTTTTSQTTSTTTTTTTSSTSATTTTVAGSTTSKSSTNSTTAKTTSTTTKNSNTNTNTISTNGSPKTGDNTPVGSLLSVVAVSLFSAVSALRKKHK